MAHVLALNIDRDNLSFWATISVLTLRANQCEIVKTGNSKTCQLLKFENVVTVHKFKLSQFTYRNMQRAT
jgi:hypothetical protein